MTVVSAMKFNKKNGAIVADEQMAYGTQKSPICVKIHHFGKGDVQVLLGRAGAADFMYDVVMNVEIQVKSSDVRIPDSRHMAHLVSSILRDTKLGYVDGYCKSEFGISRAEMQAGLRTFSDGRQLPISPEERQKYDNAMKSGPISDLTNGIFLALCYDTDGLSLYQCPSMIAQPIPVAEPYRPIGSGMLMADKVLADYIRGLPRSKWEDIDPVDGLTALLDATETASESNVFVSGTPVIRLFNDGKMVKAKEAASRLAGEIVKGTKYHYLDEEFRKSAIGELLLNDGDTEKLEAAMWEKATDKDKLSRLLRGYKL